MNDQLIQLFGSNEFDGKRKIVISSAGTSNRNNLKQYLGPKDVLYAGVLPNPSLKQLVDFFRILKTTEEDIIVGIGGGSVIDFSKLVALFVGTPVDEIKSIIETARYHSIQKALKLIIVPTLFGSGAEQTPFAVCYVGNNKYSVSNRLILPTRVEYIPEINRSASSSIKLANVLDCFCQAAESMTARNANNDSIKYAEKTLRLLVPIAKEYIEGNSIDLAAKMAEASRLCGKAIAISKTTGPHAMSYYLTNQIGLRHGYAVGVMFLFFLKMYEEKPLKEEGILFMKNVINKCLGNNGIALYPELCCYFESLGFDLIGIKNTISNRISYRNWCHSVNKERLLNGPKKSEDFLKEELLFNFFI